MNSFSEIERISTGNITHLARLFVELWPECSFDEEYEGCTKILQLEKDISFLATMNNQYIGFIHVFLRYEYIEGVTSYPIAYVEGVYM